MNKAVAAQLAGQLNEFRRGRVEVLKQIAKLNRQLEDWDTLIRETDAKLKMAVGPEANDKLN